jgi:hypothetical protein
MTPKKRNKSDLLDLADEIARGAQPPNTDVVGQAFLPATAACHFERSRESVNNSSGERRLPACSSRQLAGMLSVKNDPRNTQNDAKKEIRPERLAF